MSRCQPRKLCSPADYPPLFPPGTVYENTEQSSENICPEGTIGSPIVVTIPAGTYSSTISQEVIDAYALAVARAEAEALRVLTPCTTGYYPLIDFNFDDLCSGYGWDDMLCAIFFDPDYLYAWDDSEQYQNGDLGLIDSWILGGGPFLPESIFFDPDLYYVWDDFESYPVGDFDGALTGGSGIWDAEIPGIVIWLDYYMATMTFLDEPNGGITSLTSDGDDNPFDTGLWAEPGIFFAA